MQSMAERGRAPIRIRERYHAHKQTKQRRRLDFQRSGCKSSVRKGRCRVPGDLRHSPSAMAIVGGAAGSQLATHGGIQRDHARRAVRPSCLLSRFRHWWPRLTAPSSVSGALASFALQIAHQRSNCVDDEHGFWLTDENLVGVRNRRIVADRIQRIEDRCHRS